MTNTDKARDSQLRKNAYAKRIRENLSNERLGPPVVVGSLLSDLDLTFGSFLQLQQTRDLFGMNNDAAEMLGQLVKEREFLLLRASKHPRHRARSRRLLADYVRRAYLGDARGLLYWRRVSKVIWVAYENLLRLKRWAARTREQEIKRIARWEERAEKERVRLQKRRASLKKTRSPSGKRKRSGQSSRKRYPAPPVSS